MKEKLSLSLKLEQVLEPVYLKVSFSIQGKDFPSIIKFFEGDRYCTLIYVNKENKNDWFVRSELLSESFIKYGIPISEEVWNYMVEQIKMKLV